MEQVVKVGLPAEGKLVGMKVIRNDGSVEIYNPQHRFRHWLRSKIYHFLKNHLK